MVYLALGTNLGERERNLRRAIDCLEGAGIEVMRRSSVWETAPREVVEQPWFLNMVVECRTELAPLELMEKVLAIEVAMGRDREQAVARGPRLIDIDVLLMDELVIESERVTVPHQRMQGRRFVLEPLLELAPDLRDPRTQRPFAESLAGVADQSVRKLA